MSGRWGTDSTEPGDDGDGQAVAVLERPGPRPVVDPEVMARARAKAEATKVRYAANNGSLAARQLVRPAPVAVVERAPERRPAVPGRYYPPELKIVGRPHLLDVPAWDTDCTGGELGPDAAWRPKVAFNANEANGWMGETFWRCNKNHLGCRVDGRDGWTRRSRWLEQVIKVPVLYMAVTDDPTWVRMNNHRRYLQRCGVVVEYAWELLVNGLRLVVADGDLTPKGGPAMRRSLTADAVDKLGRWHIKSMVARHQFSPGWTPPKSVNLARGRVDRIGRARVLAGLEGKWLSMPVEEAQAEMAAAMEHVREA